jgi:hypothetical protein
MSLGHLRRAPSGTLRAKRPVVDPRMRLIAQPSEPVLLGRDADLFVGEQVD